MASCAPLLKLVTETNKAPKAVPVIIIPILNHGKVILLLFKLSSLISIPFSIKRIFSLNFALLIKYQARYKGIPMKTKKTISINTISASPKFPMILYYWLCTFDTFCQEKVTMFIKIFIVRTDTMHFES